MKAKLLMFTMLSALPALALSAASTPAPLADATAPLIDAATLQAIACEPGVAVIDVRSEKIDGQSSEDYARGHVPCALHSDYIKAGWRAKVDGVPGMLPSVPTLEALIGGLGIDNDTLVVVAPFGANSKSMAGAARVYWTFKVLGHDRVSILDGGTSGYASDAARPLEWLTRDNGGFLRSRAALEQVYGLAGVPLDAGQIAFCNTGHNSSLGWFAAHEILGNPSVRLYDGSLAQWSRNAALPVVRRVAVTE